MTKPTRGSAGSKSPGARSRPHRALGSRTVRHSKFSPGDRVILSSTGECGVVVATWPIEAGSKGDDCYVAFFGKRFPVPGKPPRQKPYILRYYHSSLRHAPSPKR